jgi:hypothetical protein
MRSTSRSTVLQTCLALGAGAFALLAAMPIGCSSSGDTAGGPNGATAPGTSDHEGAIGVALTLPGGATINTVSWVITGPNGASTVVQHDTVDVSNSLSVSFTVGNIPVGSNYTITLTATSVEGTESCVGSANFSIMARMTTAVTDLLQCNAAGQEAGSLAVNGQAYNCGTAGALSALPSETTVGHSVVLSGAATGINPATLTYSWSAPSGVFTAPAAATTNFTCTAPGTVTATLTVSDGPVPAGATCNPASTTATIQVTCDGAGDAGAPDATTGPSACSLGTGGAIKHVIYVQFDNTHLARDPDRAGDTNVPSDLEQMPHLLNFIRGNGTMMANDHTQLISHTAGGILTSLTGVYPDRHGQTVTNSMVRTSATGAFSFPSSFAYWTDPVATGTTIPNMVGPDGSNVPAPWVAYTRSGCNFGAISSANLVLENTGTSASGDVTKVFGTGSPQFTEATNSNAAASGTAARNLAVTDLEGLAVHCAQGSTVCSAGEPDLLPQEPGGYTGFNGLFGAAQIDPILTGQPASVPLTDLLGNPIVDPFNQPGFPGFDGMEAAVSLAYIASMQEHGVPVTYAYISDAHDFHGVSGNAHAAYGPGAPGYVAQLQAYDQAFANFFTRLAADGIDKTNTLFVFTVDEGDHFVGGTPTPANCDGVTTPCDWTTNNQVGEINANIDTLVSNQAPAVASKFLGSGAPNSFTVHGDDAPTFYLSRVSAAAGPVGVLGQTDPDTRNFERAAGALTAVNPFTGLTDSLLYRMVDQAGMKAIHMMTTGDTARNPVFTYFANDDYFITDFPSSTCLTCIQNPYAWNHGDDQSIIGKTWLGFVGPGVKNQADQTIFTDHTDVRPTINSLLGLHDQYQSDGRVITQALQSSGYASTLGGNLSTIEALGDNYKQITAPFGPFADCILTASTFALQTDDTTYASIESSIVNLTNQRDALVTPIRSALDAAEFGGTPVDTTQAGTWITQAQQLLTDCNTLEATTTANDAGVGGGNDAGSTSPPDSGSTPDAGAPPPPSDAGPVTTDVDIYRVGDGTSALASTGNPVFIDEFSPTGTLVRSIPLPSSGAGHKAIASGTATSEGLITLSTNGKYLLATGYDIALPNTTSLTASTAARVVARVDASGNIDTTTALTDFAVGNNPRGVASVDGTSFWVTGAAGGERFATLGATTSTQLSTTVVNLRQTGIFGGQLFVTTSSGSAVRLGTVGSGLPTTAGQTITNLPAFETSGSPYAFFFADLDGTPGLDTVYVVDDTASAPGGLSKYSLVAGSWIGNGTVGTPADSYRGVTGVVSGSTVTLFTTRKGGSGATGGGEFAMIVDSSGYNQAIAGTPSLLAMAATNTAFRGVALAPTP